jgi:amidase
MLHALKRRQISAVELLDLHLERIARYNPTLNAIVTPNFENARQAALAADAARQRGEDGPLLGLPLTIKDTIDVQGLRGTAGVPEAAERRPSSDARIVTRIRQAGGVIMGKTNVPPWADDWQANNPLFGRTNNPWDLTRTPGGSTGGGAAALAAGLTPLEFGSDIGGSIRVPAAFCGVYGHRPSQTAVPESGHFPGSPLPNASGSLGVLGPLSRSAQDLQLALTVVAGPEAGEDVGWHLTLPSPRHETLGDYRIAVLPPVPWLPLDADIASALEDLVTALTRTGAHVERTQPQSFGDLRHHHSLYLSLFATQTGSFAPPEQRRERAAQERVGITEFDDAVVQGLEASAAQYIAWYGAREEYRAAYRAFFRDWDILLAPIFSTPAFPHTDAPKSERKLEINGRPWPYSLQLGFPALAVLSGQPATVFPIGVTRDGLPIGIQAIGPYLEDLTTIHFTALVKQEFGGFKQPPGYDGI